MLDRVLAERSLLPAHDLSFLAGVPVLFHCHHFNLFWDQTIDDALGSELGTEVRTAAAREAFYDLLHSLSLALDLEAPEEKIILAQSLFSAMGHGRITLDTHARGGLVSGEYLHYGHAWNDKYGSKLRRFDPADAVAAGYAAAATEVAFGLPRESMSARERECVVQRHSRCRIDLASGPQARLASPVKLGEVERVVRPSFDGYFEESIGPISAGLRDFAGGIVGDDRGLIQAFGLYVTMHAATYYNRTGYETLRLLGRRQPQSVPVFKALLRESGHVCAFNTFGNILLSPEWEGMVGPLQGDIEEIVAGCMAIARALGFGRWSVAELVPNQRLVIRMPANYECTYFVNREGQSREGACHFTQGAALAIAQLAHRVPWARRPQLDEELYGELFRRGVPWSVEETRCVSRGDRLCEFVATRTEGGPAGRIAVG